MIQNLTNILRMAYFSDQNNKNQLIKTSRKHKSRHGKAIFNQVVEPNLIELQNLIKSKQPIQRWYLQFETNKDKYFVKKAVYDSIISNEITIHNLFLMMIQFKIFDQNVWIPIQYLCSLRGGRQNQLCCLIHYTLSNLQGSFCENSKKKWSKSQAQREMGRNFKKCYNQQIPLQQKVSILPMLLLLSQKNSMVLWRRLLWLRKLPQDILRSLETNLKNLLEPNLLQMPQPDGFTQKLFVKSVQLCEVEGFVSPQNLFSAAYELYGISQMIQLLKLYQPWQQQAKQEYKIILKCFVTEILQIFLQYHFDITKIPKDFSNLMELIIIQKLYLQELTDKSFINQYVENILICYSSNPSQYRFRNRYTLVSRITQCLSKNHNNQFITIKQNQQNQSPYRELIDNNPEHILPNILNQFYQLRPEYLQTLSMILRDCHGVISQNLDELWSQNSSWFYKLQLYLIKNYLPEFLIDNFMALETNHTNDFIETNESRMIFYYDVLAYLLKGNPISYGHLDRILIQIKQQQQQDALKSKNQHKKKSQRLNNMDAFLRGFIDKIVVSKDAIMHIISDQLQWKQNIEQNYPNANYQSYFLTEIFKNQVQWLQTVVHCICLIKITNQTNLKHKKKHIEYYLTVGPKIDKQPAISQLRVDQSQYYKWITFLLMLYYYFQQIEHTRNRRLSQMEKLIKNQKFLQNLYKLKFYESVSCGDYSKIKSKGALQLLLQKLQDWEEFYDKSSKNTIIQFGLSYPVTKMVNNKFNKKIKNFIKRKDFQQKQLHTKY